MTKKHLIFVLIIFSFVLNAAPPPVPSAGVIEKQIEKEYEAKPIDPNKKIPDIEIDLPKEKLDLPKGIKVNVCKVIFKGNESIPSKDLDFISKKVIGKKCSIVDIYKLCQKIENYYSKKGYFLARVYPPPQEIKNGVIILEILEGKLGNVKIIGNKYYSTAFIMGYFANMQNKSLKYETFLRSLMLLNENSDLMAGAIFEKGKEIGCVDVIIQVEDKTPVHLYLNGNNYGKWLTTNFRAGGRLDKGSLFKYGDKLSVAEVVGFPISDLVFTDIIYSIPCNANGSFLEAAYLFSSFHIKELSELHLEGSSDIATLKFTQALTRSRFFSCDIFSYFDYKQIKNYTLDDLTSFDKLRVLTFGTMLNHSSPITGRDYLILRMAFGLPGFLNGLNNNSSGCSRVGAKGNFFKFNFDWDHLQSLKNDCIFSLHGSFQISPDKLTVPEQIYIGGADTIRGFPLATYMGDSGYYFNLEFIVPPFGLRNDQFFETKKKWKEVLQFKVFLDQGGAQLHSYNSKFLCGTGLGMILNGPYSLSLTVDVGFPLNHRNATRDAFWYLKITGHPF